MSAVRFSDELVASLIASNSPTQICDQAGNVVGLFLPANSEMRDLCLGPDISEAELARREQSGNYLTTAEVIARLEALPDV